MNAQDYRLEDSIGYLVNRAARAIRKRLMQDFKAAGIAVSHEQWSVLIHLWNRDGQFQRELACALDKDKTTITRVVNDLEALKLVRRVADTGDARHKRIFFTRRGREQQEKLVGIAQAILADIYRGITSEERRICSKVLDGIPGAILDPDDEHR